MNYEEQLRSKDWIAAKNKILVRDKYTCTVCNNSNLLKNCGAEVFYIGNSDKILLKHGRNPIYVSYSLPKFEAYYAFFLEGEKNALIGLKGISLKEADYQEAIRNSDENTSPKEWLETNNIHRLRLALYPEKHLRHYEFDSYQSKLQKTEWITLNGLHVHHKYYQRGKCAWQYPSSALTTLCWNCHRELHQNSKIAVYDENGKPVTQYSVCGKCYGAGWFPQWLHVEEGICFECWGARYKELIT